MDCALDSELVPPKRTLLGKPPASINDGGWLQLGKLMWSRRGNSTPATACGSLQTGQAAPSSAAVERLRALVFSPRQLFLVCRVAGDTSSHLISGPMTHASQCHGFPCRWTVFRYLRPVRALSVKSVRLDSWLRETSNSLKKLIGRTSSAGRPVSSVPDKFSDRSAVWKEKSSTLK